MITRSDPNGKAIGESGEIGQCLCRRRGLTVGRVVENDEFVPFLLQEGRNSGGAICSRVTKMRCVKLWETMMRHSETSTWFSPNGNQRFGGMFGSKARSQSCRVIGINRIPPVGLLQADSFQIRRSLGQDQKRCSNIPNPERSSGVPHWRKVWISYGSRLRFCSASML